MLLNLVRKSTFPVLLAPKKKVTLRHWGDYCKLNADAVRGSYVLPGMYECIASLGGLQVFSRLDAKSVYWQIEVDTDDRQKTAFSSQDSFYQLAMTRFGLITNLLACRLVWEMPTHRPNASWTSVNAVLKSGFPWLISTKSICSSGHQKNVKNTKRCSLHLSRKLA